MTGEAGPWPLPQGTPDRLGEHRLLALLDQDGHGTVYLAENAAGERVALTVLNVSLPNDWQAQERFVQEIEAARWVALPGTARVISATVVDGFPVIAGELVKGESLRRIVTRGGPFQGEGLIRLAAETITILAGMHGVGVVHGNFGPDRVLFGPDGPKVTEFCVARALAATGVAGPAGVPGFMSPEQVAGFPAGPAADVFGWAATMVFAATGVTFPGGGAGPAGAGWAGQTGPDLSGLPEPLRGWLPACLDGDPARRPTANDVMLALPQAAHGHPAPVARPPFGPHGGPADHPPFAPPGAAPRRSRWPWVAGVAGALVLALSATIAVNVLNGEEAAEGTRRNVTAGTTATPAVTPATAPASPGPDFGTPLWTSRVSDPWVASVAVSTAGGAPLVATGGDKGTVDVFRLDNGATAVSPIKKAHKGRIAGLAATVHNGRSLLVSGGEDQTVRRWDLATGNPVGEPAKSEYQIFKVGALELSGRQIVAVESGDDSLLDLDGSGLAPLPIDPSRCSGPAKYGALDGRLIKVCIDNDFTLGVWDVREDKRIGETGQGHGTHSTDLALGTVGGRPVIATSGEDGTVRRWDLATGKPVGEPIAAGPTDTTSSGVAVTRLAGRPVIVSYANYPDSSIRVWDWETGDPVGTPIPLQFTGTAMEVVESGGKVIVVLGSADGMVGAWNLGAP
ncbi:WD40 repeat domain-containing serine/threonine protein kinase [Streptosporangium fragile]|uniref:WD40 repeat domain-containing serine/threonine protein kinase n=1 Tax=Streptosporangium fragile TaxID=46186 RepID=UPI0031EC8478